MELCGLNAAFLGGLPEMGRSLLGPLFRAPVERYVRRLKAELGPVFESRLRDQPGQEGGEKPSNMPVDLLSMLVQHASVERPDHLNLDNMARRIAVSNVHAMSQATIASINLILNIIGSDAEHETISTLRDEIAAATSGSNLDAGFWTKANAASLTKADSVARETMRLHSVANRALARKVVADGLKTEDGVVLPKGCTVSILSHAVHRGEEYFFENADVFEPFRYCKSGRDVPEFHSAETASLVTTGPQFLPFGHGKTACPGRFILDFELKMLVAYLLQNYHVRFPSEYGGRRPNNIWIAESNLPPMAQIQVRRR
jgi:cytochrome P450